MIYQLYKDHPYRKTQTILNIIGNYIFQNKTVCVVSKNNSAIDNVMKNLSSVRNFMILQLEWVMMNIFQNL